MFWGRDVPRAVEWGQDCPVAHKVDNGSSMSQSGSLYTPGSGVYGEKPSLLSAPWTWALTRAVPAKDYLC